MSPIKNMARTVTRDVEVRGQRSTRATRSCSSTRRPTATRRCSTDPTLDVTRDPNPHLAFGFGTALLPRRVARPPRAEGDVRRAAAPAARPRARLDEPLPYRPSNFISAPRRCRCGSPRGARPKFPAMPDYETLLVRKDDGVAWVSLNRPKVRNAINQQMQDELADVGPRSATTTTSAASCSAARASRSARASTGTRRSPRRTTRRWRPGTTPATRPRGCTTTLAATWDRRPRPLEARHRRGTGHGVRRRVLHAGRGRVHHRHRRRHLLRSPRHLRHDRRLRAHADALEDAVPRGHAHVAARRPRAHVCRAGARSDWSPRSCPATSCGSGPRGWPGSSPTRRRSSSRGRCGRCGPPSRCRAPRASTMANLFTRIGSDAAAFKAGQDRFASGQRVEWRRR